MKLLALVLLAATAVGLACAREDGNPEPPTQVLVPCHPDAGAGDPLACPPGDAGMDDSAAR